MKTFTIIFLLGFFVSCASNQDKPVVKEEPARPYTDYPNFYR
jgi:hypothetical protein